MLRLTLRKRLLLPAAAWALFLAPTAPLHAQGICDRTAPIRDAIIAEIAAVTTQDPIACEAVTNSDLAKAEELILSGALVDTTPPLKDGDFDGLTGLSDLRLNGNQLTSLPDGIFDEMNPGLLHLQDNQLTSLPAGIFDHMSGFTLNLRNNRLTEYSSGVFQAPGFNFLGLEGNEITSLTRENLSGTGLMYYLQLNGNPLMTLPADLFRERTNIYELELDDTGLTALPAGLFTGFTNLIALSLRDNEIDELPPGTFEGLTSLGRVHITRADDSNFEIDLRAFLLRATSSNGVVVRVREGTPLPATLTLTIEAEDGTGSPEITIPPGSVDYAVPGEVLREHATAGVTVTVRLRAQDHRPESSEQGRAITSGFRYVVTRTQSQTITVPGDGDTVGPVDESSLKEYGDPDPDVNRDNRVNANDALILYYAYSLGSELGNGR